MIKKQSLLCLAFLLLLVPTLVHAQQDSSEAPLIIIPSAPDTYNLLYQVQQKKRTTAAVGELYTPGLRKTNSTTFGGWLSGRLAGIHTFQGSGEPGADDVSVFLRGHAPLILIDGTPQSFPSINPEQVESITVLKDAVATAMLGMRGGNGAILITTRKGIRQAQHIEFTAQQGIQRPTRLPSFANAYNYASLYNEALANDGLAPVYTQADLDAYRNGTDPIGHPNVDWQKEVLKKQTPFGRYDLVISGGNKTTRYFVNLDYLGQNGLLKEESFNVYKTNSDYKRYLLRSNIEVDLNPAITTALNLFGRIQQSNQPGATTASIFDDLRNTPNNAYPRLNSDSSLGGNLDYQNNLYGQSLMSGYLSVYERDFKVDLSLKAKLDVLAKGLWIRGLAAINAYQRETINRSKTFAVFRQSDDGAGNKSYTRYGTTGDQQNSNAANSQNRLFYTELSLGYSTSVNNTDFLEALILVNNDYRMVNTDLPFNYTGVAAKLSYDHKQTYFIDVTAGYNGTERFPKSKRFGLFPAIGLGWELTNENFLKNRISWLNSLKLRTSAGKTGNANVGYYDYYQYYVGGSGYGFGSTVPSSTFTLQQGQLANPFITWEKANKFSAGAEATAFGNRLNLSIDYFNEKYYDLVQARLDGSEILGTDYMRENIGENRYSGMELQASWQVQKAGFGYFLAPNFSLLKSKVLYMAEPQRMFDYLRLTGKPVGQSYGYVADGFFASTTEINSHAYQGPGIVPGDIRYKDLNGDNVIDGNDQTAIGNTRAFIYYGLNAGINYHGFDLTVLFQGVANRDVNLSGYRAFQNNGRGQLYEEQLQRWTPATATSATYPRLWVGNNLNNQLVSSYWIHSGNYLRVKNLEIGYSLPAQLIGKLKLTTARFFVNATNLFTFSPLNDWNIDPEAAAGGYPIMRTITAGLSIKL